MYRARVETSRGGGRVNFDLIVTVKGTVPLGEFRDQVILVTNDNRSWADNASFSIGVSDLEALYQEYREIPGRVGPLEMKAWGRLEFHMIVPSGVCLQFYEHDAA